jgi:hypothetical protein
LFHSLIKCCFHGHPRFFPAAGADAFIPALFVADFILIPQSGGVEVPDGFPVIGFILAGFFFICFMLAINAGDGFIAARIDLLTTSTVCAEMPAFRAASFTTDFAACFANIPTPAQKASATSFWFFLLLRFCLAGLGWSI